VDLGLTDRVYVVTAGSKGLGFATAQALVADGARVLIAARDEGALLRAGEALGERASVCVIDLSEPNAAQYLANVALERHGSLDGLVLNLGGPAPWSALAYTDTQWTAAIEGVLLATIRLARAFAPILANDGSMLAVLSTTVREPIASLGASNVLRPGLAMLVKDLSVELAPRVRVNGILPGRIATDRMLALTDGDPDAQRAIESSIPMGRLGHPKEFGEVAAFLLSPAASYITGALVPVDGGILHSPW